MLYFVFPLTAQYLVSAPALLIAIFCKNIISAVPVAYVTF